MSKSRKRVVSLPRKYGYHFTDMGILQFPTEYCRHASSSIGLVSQMFPTSSIIFNKIMILLSQHPSLLKCFSTFYKTEHIALS